MTEQPLVSVIINCYNGEEFLRETIDSVINQTYSNWELIFWDNQSTDSTAEIIKGYHDDRIRYFYAPAHTPLGEARNLAMKQVGGKYLAFLDADDIWYPDFLMIGVEFLEKDLSCVGFYCNYHYHNKNNQLVTISRNTTVSYHDYRYLLKIYDVGMSGSLVRFETVRSHDILFKKQYNLIEDYDFFLCLSKYGLLVYYPEPKIFYRVHPNSTTCKLRDDWAIEFNYMYNEIKKDMVDNDLLEESDLLVLRKKYLEMKFESIASSGIRRNMCCFLRDNSNFINFRLKIKCLLYLILGPRILNYIRCLH